MCFVSFQMLITWSVPFKCYQVRTTSDEIPLCVSATSATIILHQHASHGFSKFCTKSHRPRSNVRHGNWNCRRSSIADAQTPDVADLTWSINNRYFWTFRVCGWKRRYGCLNLFCVDYRESTRSIGSVAFVLALIAIYMRRRESTRHPSGVGTDGRLYSTGC